MKWILYVTVFVYMCCRGVLSQEEELKPSLHILARSTTFDVGERKAIFCKLINLEDGDWYNPWGQVVGLRSAKNNRVFVEKKNFENAILLMPLVINNTTIDDSGNYTCKSGNFEESFNILVGKKVVMEPSKDTVYGNEGETSRLDCEPEGSPEPLVQWYKNQIPIDDEFLAENKRYNIITKGHNRQLEIKNVNHMDTGEYVCKVTQKLLSHSTDKTITFIVHHKPVLVDPDTQEVNLASSEEVFTILNRVKNLTCNAVAYPLPEFKWHRRVNGDDIPILDDSVSVSPDGLSSVMQLRVYNESYLGIYKCTASNPHGQRYILFNVRQGNKPNPPDQFSVVSSNATAITFNLTCSTCNLRRIDEGVSVPDNLSVTGYKIKLTVSPKPDTPPNWDEALTFNFEFNDTNNTLFTATNLTSSTSYNARACSVNEAGESEWLELGAAAVTAILK